MGVGKNYLSPPELVTFNGLVLQQTTAHYDKCSKYHHSILLPVVFPLPSHLKRKLGSSSRVRETFSMQAFPNQVIVRREYTRRNLRHHCQVLISFFFFFWKIELLTNTH